MRAILQGGQFSMGNPIEYNSINAKWVSCTAKDPKTGYNLTTLYAVNENIAKFPYNCGMGSTQYLKINMETGTVTGDASTTVSGYPYTVTLNQVTQNDNVFTAQLTAVYRDTTENWTFVVSVDRTLKYIVNNYNVG